MARIPVYTQQTQAPGGVSFGNLRVPDMNLDATGKGLQQVGQALTQVAQVTMRIEEENQKTKALESLLNDEMAEKQLFAERKSDPNIAPGAEGFTKNILKDFDERYNERLKNMPDGPGKKYYSQGILRLRSSLFDQAISFEALEGQKYTIGVAKQAAKGYAGLSSDNPDPTEIATRIGEYSAWVDSMSRLSPSQKQELKEYASQLNYTSALEKVIDKDPEGFLKRAESKEGDELLANISPDKRDTFIKAARTSLNQKQSIYRSELSTRLNDAVAMAQQGIIDPNPIRPEEFVRAFGEKDGPAKYNSYRQTQVLAAEIRSINTMPASELVSFVESRKPAPGTGFAERQNMQEVRQRAAMATLKAREADPATFVITNSRPVNSAYGEMARIQNDANASPEQKSAATQRYVTASIAEQERLGIVNQKILSDSMRDSLARRINQGNERSADIVADLERTYGRQYFPMVMREMMQDNKLPPAMMIIPDLDSFDSREVVSRVTATDKKALEAGVAEQERTAIKRRVTEHIATLRSSAGPMSVQMASQLAAYEETMYRVALERVGRGVDKSGAAAADAANTMLLGKYQFKGTLRLPKNVDAGNVTSGLNRSLSDQIVPSLTMSDVPMDQTAARTPAEALAEWKSTVASRGIWISNNDTTAAQLWAQGKNGEFFRVMRGGKQVEMSFDDAVQARRGFANQQPIEGNIFDQMIGP